MLSLLTLPKCLMFISLPIWKWSCSHQDGPTRCPRNSTCILIILSSTLLQQSKCSARFHNTPLSKYLYQVNSLYILASGYFPWAIRSCGMAPISTTGLSAFPRSLPSYLHTPLISSSDCSSFFSKAIFNYFISH